MKKKVNMHRYYKFLLYVIIVVLINIAGASLFFRIDLTSSGRYSLSKVSKEVVSTLSEPLTIKVFFTKNLPAPYNDIERYLNDLLQEYAVAGNRYFNYEFYDVTTEGDRKAIQNQKLAEGYGIEPVQIQKIEHDQVKYQKAYMGLVMMHGDIIKTIPDITSTNGLEYRITSAIRQMNDKISALLRLKDKVNVKLFLSSSLQAVAPYMNLNGLSGLPRRIEKLVDRLNRRNYGKLSFSYLDPSLKPEYEKEAEKYHILALRWNAFRDRSGRRIDAGKGYAGIVIQYGGRAEQIHLINAFRLPLFGTQYQLAENGDIEKAINSSVENLIHVNEQIGYLADHGTLTLGSAYPLPGQSQTENLSNFNKFLREEYTIKRVNLKDGGIPEGLPLLIIAGPKEKFTDYELYQIDQFLMKGRSLAIFLDSFKEVRPQNNGEMMTGYNGMPSYLPLNTGLEKLLKHYGMYVEKAYVLDKTCFNQRVPVRLGGGEHPIYFAPIIKDEFINKNVDFLKNIKGLVLLKASPVDIDKEVVKKNGLKAIRLFSSSKESWEMKDRITLNPMVIYPPRDKSKYKQVSLAYILEGSFPSYFADRTIPVKKQKNKSGGKTGKNKGIDTSKVTGMYTTIKRSKSARIFLIGTSEILTNRVFNEDGTSPNDQFVMNTIDYLNGREGYAVMRSKIQQFNPLKDIGAETKTAIKVANIVGLPILVIFTGLVIWFRNIIRKRRIQQIFMKR